MICYSESPLPVLSQWHNPICSFSAIYHWARRRCVNRFRHFTPLHATWSGMRHLKWHEVACSRCDTPLEVACATWSGIRHLKWHEVACSRCDTPLEVACATWSGIRHSEHEGYTVSTPLEVAHHSKWHATWSGIRHSKWHATWSGMKWQNQNPPHLLVLCHLWNDNPIYSHLNHHFQVVFRAITAASTIPGGPSGWFTIRAPSLGLRQGWCEETSMVPSWPRLGGPGLTGWRMLLAHRLCPLFFPAWKRYEKNQWNGDKLI